MTAGGIAAIPRAPGWLPLIGHAVPLRNPLEFLKTLRHTGDLVRIHLGTLPVVVPTSHELVHEVLLGKGYEKGRLYDRMELAVGGGLATNETTHIPRRRAIQPVFNDEYMEHYSRIMAARAQRLSDSLRPGERIDVDKAMSGFAIGSLAECMFSSELGHDAVESVQRIIPVILETMLVRAVSPPVTDRWERWPMTSNSRFIEAARELRSVIDDVIERTSRSEEQQLDLVSLLMAAQDPETGLGLSLRDVRDELATMQFAGTETTAATLTWTFHELARQPRIQEAVVAEIDRVVGEDPVGYAHVGKLEYTQKVLQEALRLHGVTMVMRRVKKDAPVTLGGYELPAGTEVVLSLYAVNRHPGLYEDPEVFDPERDQPDRKYRLSFGAGKRKCIGEGFSLMEATILLATLLRRWRLEPVPGHTVKEAVSAMAHADSMPMTVHPRQDV
ncbi:cytochrome P450 [Streptomyces nanshensis]|uniref:cytochrome P450 n=1 Tax=Streptomyces nanshensis TaxID=518642 RepID=UPI0009A019C5|nr:cytochrome P450 [Streptomyces nanshensis]